MRGILLFIYFVVLSFTFVFAQQTSKNKWINQHIQTDSFNVPINSSTYYFPLESFYNKGKNNVKISNYLDTWYSKMLYALNEPLLYNKLEEKEVYRFTWLRSAKNPVSIRIEKDNETIKLFLKVSDGESISNPGKLITNKNKILSISQWNTFKSKINKIRFWTLPVEEIKSIGKDGSEWILEGSVKDNYHFATRWSPNEYNLLLYKDCCKYLITLSEYNLPSKETP